MAPANCAHPASVPPPSYHHTVARAPPLDALTLVTRLELLTLCRLAVQLTQRQCPPPLSAGRGGAPCVYTEETPLLLALGCWLPLGIDGQPRVPSKAQQSKRLRAAGAPPSELPLVLLAERTAMTPYQVTVDEQTLQRLFRGDGQLAHLLEAIFNQVLEAQVAEQLQARRYKRSE
jgi:hypothetical protein